MENFKYTKNILDNIATLCGSRYFNSLDKDLVPITNTEDIDDDDLSCILSAGAITDYDYYMEDHPLLISIIIDNGFEIIHDGDSGYCDDLVVAIYQKKVFDNLKEFKFQVVVRSDVILYKKVIDSITPEFYSKYLWKSGISSPTKEQIRDIINQLIRTAKD
jgi:hypothetical protein